MTTRCERHLTFVVHAYHTKTFILCFCYFSRLRYRELRNFRYMRCPVKPWVSITPISAIHTCMLGCCWIVTEFVTEVAHLDELDGFQFDNVFCNKKFFFTLIWIFFLLFEEEARHLQCSSFCDPLMKYSMSFSPIRLPFSRRMMNH